VQGVKQALIAVAKLMSVSLFLIWSPFLMIGSTLFELKTCKDNLFRLV